VPPTFTHLAIGERAFGSLGCLERSMAVYGRFLLGCLLADVNNLDEGDALDRRRTHFLDPELAQVSFWEASLQSCARFLERRAEALARPWGDLSASERAFVAGYLCHLAADEAQARLLRTMRAWGGAHRDAPLQTMRARALPRGVLRSALNVLSAELLLDPSRVADALGPALVPDVLAHVPHAALLRMWALVRPHVIEGNGYLSYLDMLGRQGRPAAEVEAMRLEHERHWDAAVALLRGMDAAGAFVRAGVRRSLAVLPRLWAEG
jgi:hypothetical protein